MYVCIIAIVRCIELEVVKEIECRLGQHYNSDKVSCCSLSYNNNVFL